MRFERDGYVVVRQAFSRADALAMERQWRQELRESHGIRQFPGPGAWEVPAGHWHWDNPCELHLDRPRALFVVSFIGPVAPGGGGTLILSGSPRPLIQREHRIPARHRGDLGGSVWARLRRSHPWLMALTGQAPSPADRTAAFMDREAIVDGVPLRVAELTGEPGTWSSAIPSWSTASRRTGARDRASCGSSSRSSRTRVASCAADWNARTRRGDRRGSRGGNVQPGPRSADSHRSGRR